MYESKIIIKYCGAAETSWPTHLADPRKQMSHHQDFQVVNKT